MLFSAGSRAVCAVCTSTFRCTLVDASAQSMHRTLKHWPRSPGAVRCHYEMTGGFVVGASFRDQLARTARRSDLPFHTRFRAAIPFLLSADGMALRGAVCCLLLALEVFSTRVDARRGLTQGAPTLSGHALLGSDIQCVRASGRVRPARWPRGAGEPRCDVQRCTSQRRCLGPADQRSSSAAGGGVLW